MISASAVKNRGLLGCANASTPQDYTCLQRVKAPLLEHLVRFHEQHDERFTNWLKHFDAMLWLKLALVHGRQGLLITMEYDLRQYLKLSTSVGLAYFQRHAGSLTN